jgi:hypothetical protein
MFKGLLILKRIFSITSMSSSLTVMVSSGGYVVSVYLDHESYFLERFFK